MRFSRRRKPRVTWMPNPGTLTNAAEVLGVHSFSGLEFVVQKGTSPGAGNWAFVELPMVQDVPYDPGSDTISNWRTLTLDRTKESGYRLRRIVGNLYIAGISNAEFDPQAGFAALPPPAMLVQAGVIVRRVGDDGESLASTSPLTASDLQPGSLDNNDDPWVWRRNWVITNVQSQTSFANYPDQVRQGIAASAPPSNWEFGSGNVGGLVDTKIGRRIGAEERLFFNVTVWALPISTDSSGVVPGWGAYVLFDYRVLGSIFTSAGNRRNASR